MRSNPMIEAFQFDFMRNALAAGVLASVICGIMVSGIAFLLSLVYDRMSFGNNK